MRFTRMNRNTTIRTRMMGFTQVFVLLIAVLLLGAGIFDLINPDVFMFGNASYVMVIIGGMMLVVGFMTSLSQMYHLNEVYAWVGSLVMVATLAILILIVSMIFEGGFMNG